ncbi:acyl-CoA N-acyltransferase [Delphinella strobiligena]|nr:acyl-CoA N-acyltransferase [Delphinella strobiligena]
MTFPRPNTPPHEPLNQPEQNPCLFSIHPATSSHDISAIKVLFTAYTSSLNLDLSFQSYAEELAGLPGKYAAPTGCLLLAHSTTTSSSNDEEKKGEREILGCVGLRPLDLDAGICEMKRLYVTPAGRGSGVGKALVERVIADASVMGYRQIKLDTLPCMHSAIRVYEQLGFEKGERYYDTPIEGAVFLKLDLDRKEAKEMENQVASWPSGS